MPSNDSATPRPEIALAWKRAQLNGLDPGSQVEPRLSEIDAGSRLMAAAGPVLDALAQQLRDTRFSVLLADREGRIIDRRVGEPRLTDALDDVLAVPGCQYTEDVAGTNALATAFELRRGISVTGDEHFLESLKQFCCYGEPIIHPATGRFEGVLDVTGHLRDATELLEPFLAQAARDIEQRLLAGSRMSDQRMLAAFRARASRTTQPILVLGDGLTLTNRAAADTFDASAARQLSHDLTSEHGTCTLYSRAGRPLPVRYEIIPGTTRGILFEATAAEQPRVVIPRARATGDHTFAGHRRSRTRVLIHGEPGSGRTRAARALAGSLPLTVLDGGQLTSAEVEPRTMSESADHLLVIDGIHLLDDPTAVAVARLLDDSPGWFALTSSPVDQLTGERIGLAARCTARWETQPLRGRREDIPMLARSVLADYGSHAHLSPSALGALCRYDWPGNLAELSAVLRVLAKTHHGEPITDTDLPAHVRRTSRRLSALEQSERDTIVSVLDRCGGNKAHAAELLGIGRTTLYRRLRELSVT